MTNSVDEHYVTVSSAEHGHWIANALRNLFDFKRRADFDLRWNGKSARAHKTILELFLAPEIIGADQIELNTLYEVKQEVPDDADGGSTNQLDFLLEFLYKGEVDVPEKQLKDLLRLARQLDFKLLVDAVQSCSPVDIKADDGIVIKMEEEDTDSCTEDVLKAEETVDFGTCTQSSYEKSGAEHLQHWCSATDCYNVAMSASELNGFETNKTDTSQCLMGYSNIGMPVCEIISSEATDDDSLQNLEKSLSAIAESQREMHLRLGEQGFTKCSDQPEHYNSEQILPGEINAMNLYSDRILVIDGSMESKDIMLHCGGSNYDDSFEASSTEANSSSLEENAGSLNCAIMESSNLETNNSQKIDLLKCPHCKYENVLLKGHENVLMRGLSNHILSVHKLTLDGKPAPKLKCPECDYTSTVRHNLNSHLRLMHGKDNYFSCHLCSYTARQKGNLKRHQSVVHVLGSNPIICETCGKLCSSRHDLMRHMLTHTQARPFKCTQCDFSANTSCNLKEHLLAIHCASGLKKRRSRPITECPYCHKALKGNYCLKNHVQKMHGPDGPKKKGPVPKSQLPPEHSHLTQERPFKCPHCQHATKNKYNLKHHIRKLHGPGGSNSHGSKPKSQKSIAANHVLMQI